jgi:tetratricopeptide (TPR) repeat protein
VTALLFLCTCDDPPPQKSASLASRIELAAGNVSVKQTDGKWERAIAGLLLRHGTEVKVGPGDRALIRMDDGSSVFLRHGTSIKLEPEGLTLSAGEAWIDSPGQDQKPASYRAGDVAVSAAGAGLDLRRTGERVEVYVARGFAVVAAPGGRTEVQAGEKVTIQGKGAPKVGAVSFWEDWTGGMADRTLQAGVGGAGTGRIYAINRGRPGSPPQELEVRAQHVRVLIRKGISRTIVDQRFFNPGSAPVEGYYWFTIPEGAAVDRFALDVNGTLVDGEVAERKQARGAYEAAIRQTVDPALLEWIDGRTYRARIFPIPRAGERRVVISYLEALPTVDNKVHYIYPMGGAPRVQEFALEVDLGDEGKGVRIATTADARVEEGGKKVSMRRSGFNPQGDFLLEMAVKESEPLRAMRVESGRAEAAYVALRYMPDVDWSQVKQIQGNVVVVVDTSAGGDDADRQLRSDVAEAILRALSTGDRFALMAADLKPRVLYPRSGLAKADEANVGRGLEALSAVSRGGATDLGGLFDVALKRLHGSVQPAVVYIGDGRPTVGELEGDMLAGRLTRSMAGSAARLFTIAAGTRVNHALLERLARIGGGRTFRVDLSQQAVQEALRFVGLLKTPTITDLKMDVGAGLDQVFSTAAGKVSRGQEVMLLARTHHPLPKKIKVTGRLAGKAFKKDYDVETRSGSDHAYVPKLWARRYLTHLLGTDREKNRGTIIRLGLDYALMTPFTSFLVLESDAAYQRYGIQRRPRHPYWGIVPHAVELGAAIPLAIFGCAKRDEARAPGSTIVQQEHAARGAAAKSMPAASTPREEPPPPPPEPAADEARPAKAMLRTRHKTGRAEMEKKRLEEPRDADDGEERPQVIVLKVCSDASRRSLAHRRAIWERRLDMARSMAQRVAVYRRARGSCELPHWRDRKAMLDLLQARVRTPADARQLLQAVSDRKGREFVQRRLLTRAVSGEMSQALQLAETVDWSIADAALARAGGPEQRVIQLRELCQKHRRSAGCAIRLIQALIAAGKTREALSVALKMRADGLATPALMQQVGDLLAAAGRPEQAMRVYSEIVEFSPDDPAARRLLGDIYLRHRWYQAAYRQYRTLTQVTPDAPLALLRLAAAASGTGRGDEALRLERKVASGEGEPGPKDPRRWARMWSAARIARLMLAQKGGKESLRQSMERSLRRLQVLTAPGVLFLLTWEDLGARLAMDLKAGQPINWSDRVNASPTGLVAISTSSEKGSQVTATVSRSGSGIGRSDPQRGGAPSLPSAQRDVRFKITTIRWDGSKMHISSQDGKVGDQPTQKTVAVP